MANSYVCTPATVREHEAMYLALSSTKPLLCAVSVLTHG